MYIICYQFAFLSLLSILLESNVTADKPQIVFDKTYSQVKDFQHNYLSSSNEPFYKDKANIIIFSPYYTDVQDNIIDMKKGNIDISAEVILKAKSGRSMINENTPITSENIEQFQPSYDSIKNAADIFEKLHFAVFNNNLTITIQGKPDLFEKVFDVKLTVEKNMSTGKIAITSDRELNIPKTLTDMVEGVVFTPSPDYHI